MIDLKCDGLSFVDNGRYVQIEDRKCAEIGAVYREIFGPLVTYNLVFMRKDFGSFGSMDLVMKKLNEIKINSKITRSCGGERCSYKCQFYQDGSVVCVCNIDCAVLKFDYLESKIAKPLISDKCKQIRNLFNQRSKTNGS